jgi:hypothetical protein
MSKVVYGIRHAEGWHNILFSVLKEKAYTDFQDSSLTVKGMHQARQADIPKGIEVVYVSPLVRTLQTAQLMFPNVQTIALECLKEYPQEREQCNRRSSRSILKDIFPNVDFSNLLQEDQPWPNQVACETNLNAFKSIIATSPCSVIGVVTHSTWLKYCMTKTLKSSPELKHCVAYELNIN